MPSSFLRLFLKALRLPVVLVILGYILSSLPFFPFLHCKKECHEMLRGISDIGDVVSALGYVLFFYLVLVGLCRKLEASQVDKGNMFFAKVLDVLKRGIRFIFAFIAIYTILSTLELPYQSLDIAHKIIGVLIISSVAWLVLQVLSMIEVIFQHKHQALQHTANSRLVHLRYTQIHQIRNIVAFVVVIVATAAALMVFDSVRSVGISILASAGFLTAILGLAAQKTLSSLFIGMQLALSQPFGIDDVVTVENEVGIIEEITLNYIVVRILDGRRLVLPVSYFIEKPFTNWSHNEEGFPGTIKLYVDYTLPIASMRAQLIKVLNELPFWDKKRGTIIVSDLKEHAVELTVAIKVMAIAELGDFLPKIREKLLEFMSEHYPDCFPRTRIRLTEPETNKI
ncbi:MAG: mscK 1 [Gammaproteobacteria bacterium]|nr:mscK 1 [Gammaproteobacteria bacterium]